MCQIHHAVNFFLQLINVAAFMSVRCFLWCLAVIQSVHSFVLVGVLQCVCECKHTSSSSSSPSLCRGVLQLQFGPVDEKEQKQGQMAEKAVWQSGSPLLDPSHQPHSFLMVASQFSLSQYDWFSSCDRLTYCWW